MNPELFKSVEEVHQTDYQKFLKVVQLSFTSPEDPHKREVLSQQDLPYDLFTKLLHETYEDAQTDKEALEERQDEWSTFPKDLNAGAPKWLLMVPDQRCRCWTPTVVEVLLCAPSTGEHAGRLVDLGLVGRMEFLRLLYKALRNTQGYDNPGAWFENGLKRSWKWIVQDAPRIGSRKGRSPVEWEDKQYLYLTNQQWTIMRPSPVEVSQGAPPAGDNSQQVVPPTEDNSRQEAPPTENGSQQEASPTENSSQQEAPPTRRHAAAAAAAAPPTRVSPQPQEQSTLPEGAPYWVCTKKDVVADTETWEKRCKGTGRTLEVQAGSTWRPWSQWQPPQQSSSSSLRPQQSTSSSSNAVDYSAGLRNTTQHAQGWGTFQQKSWNKMRR